MEWLDFRNVRGGELSAIRIWPAGDTVRGVGETLAPGKAGRYDVVDESLLPGRRKPMGRCESCAGLLLVALIAAPGCESPCAKEVEAAAPKSVYYDEMIDRCEAGGPIEDPDGRRWLPRATRSQ